MQFRVFCNALTVDCLEDFQRLIENELPLPFSHRILICGLGYITVENTVHTFRILNFGFPMEYLQAIRTADGGISSPVMQNWIKAGKPQLYNADIMATSLPESWCQRFQQFGLSNLAAHGLIDRQQRQMSYFNFCDTPTPLTDHHGFLLEILVPPLHAALLRVIQEAPPLGIEPSASSPSLTERELELLSHLAQGRDQRCIAECMGISEHTVRNHLRSLYMKLGVNKATQAIEKSKRLHLLKAV